MVIKTLKDWGAVAVAVLALAGVVYAAGGRSADLSSLERRVERVENKVDRILELLAERRAVADTDTRTD